MKKTIYTIGYQGMSLDRLLEIMDDRGIRQVLDIRSKPYSRLSAWNMKSLKKRLGDRYIWKGDSLGGLEGPVKPEGIDYLINKPETVVLLCMEHDPRKCHRHQDVAPRLRAQGVMVIHLIDEGGPHAIGIADTDL